MEGKNIIIGLHLLAAQKFARWLMLASQLIPVKQGCGEVKDLSVGASLNVNSS